VNRGFALTIGFVAALVPAMAQAQTNIDQGKSASQLFGNSCAECHKAPHSLAKGKSAAAVAQFLSEHYTTGRDQAAALAIYVTSGRDTVASPVPGRKPRPGETANAKPRRPGEAEAPSSGGSMMNPIARPEPAQRDNKPTTATRNRRPETPAEPGTVANAPTEATPEAPRPAPVIAPAQEPTTATVAPTAAAPVPAEAPPAPSGETGSRDNIPD
jgi:mono/diheme cytochrome c family protein